MKKYFVFIAMVFLFISGSSFAATVTVQATVDKTSVALGEPLTLIIQVKASGSLSGLGEPRLPDLQGFNLVGKNQGSSSRLSITNGQVQNEVIKEFQYTLMAESVGKLKIGEAEVTLDGVAHSTRPIVIDVSRTASNRQRQQAQPQPNPFGSADPFDEDDLFSQLLRRRGIDPNTGLPMQGGGGSGGGGRAEQRTIPGINPDEAFFIRAEVDKTQVVVGEQITASWYLYTRSFVRDIDTLKYPDLTPFVKEDIEVATRLNFMDEVVNGIPYKKALLVSYALFPLKEGTATIDSYRAKCTVISSQFGSSMGQNYSYTKASPEVKIKVLALPTQGRPHDFTGAVGEFDLTASVGSSRVETGQPFSLKVRLEGRGNAKMIELPPVDLPTTLESFDTKSDAKYFKDGTSYKEFELFLIPRQAGPLQLPPITISVYDPKSKTYEQKSVAPISLVVGQGKVGDAIKGTQMEAGGNAPQAAKALRQLPPPAIGNGGGFTSIPPQAPSVWAALYSLVMAFLIYWGYREIFVGRKKRDLAEEMKKRFRIIRGHVDISNHRAVGADTLNALYSALGAFASEGGKANMSVEKLVLKVPPSIRKELEKPLKDLFPFFESLSFAPDGFIEAMKTKENMKSHVDQMESVLMKIIAANVASSERQTSEISKSLTLFILVTVGFSEVAFAKPIGRPTSQHSGKAKSHLKSETRKPTAAKGASTNETITKDTKKENAIGWSVSFVELSTKDEFWNEPRLSDGVIVTGPKKPRPDLDAFIKTREALQKQDATACLQQSAAALVALKKAKGMNFQLEAWVARMELQCLEVQLKSAKPDLGRAQTRLDQIARQHEWFVRGSSGELLKNTWKQTALTHLELLAKAKSSKTRERAETLLSYKNWYTPSERARFLFILGEAAFQVQNLDAARSFLERSLGAEELPEARAKLQLVESSLGITKALKNSDGEPVTDESPKEKDLGQRFLYSLKTNDIATAMEDAIALLADYPAGVKSKLASDKLFELYSSVSEKDDPKFVAVKERALSLLRKADGPRLSRWSLSAYRAGSYSDALIFGRDAIGRMESMSGNTKTIWIAARAAQATGETKRAREWFNLIVDQHSGEPEYVDALIQLALMALRENDSAAAITSLERVLSRPRDPSKEVIARYWLWQALEKIDAARAKNEAQGLLTRFPLSYYGLRARAELNNNEIIAPLSPNEPRVAKIWMSKTEQESFDRVKFLYEAGWWEEAQVEFRDIPESSDPVRRALLARVSASIFDFPRAISQFNRILESDPTLAQDPFLRNIFPRTFWPEISEESSTRKLEPALVASLMRQESAFNPRAVSTSGAIGLMQMIPKTVQEVAGLLKVKNLQLPNDMFDPKPNIRFCTFYLGRMIADFEGAVPFGLAAYNAGPTRLKRWMKAKNITIQNSSLPIHEVWIDELPWDETQFYVKAILRNLILYRLLDRGRVQFTDPLWAVTAK